MSESLRKRVITAAVLIALLLVVLFWLPAAATVVLLTLVVLMGAWEWSAFLRLARPLSRAAYVALVAASACRWRGGRRARPAGLEALLGAALLWWLAALVWIVTAPAAGPALVGGARRIAVPGAGLARAGAPAAADAPHGAQWVLFALVLVWMADIGAYFCGRALRPAAARARRLARQDLGGRARRSCR